MELTRMIKVALTSRKLFRNWLWAGMKYYLYRHGILHTDKVEVVCRDGSRDTIPIEIYGSLINGYFDGIVTDYSCKEHAMRFGNHSWFYDAEHGHWYKDNVKFKRMHRFILEVFEFGEYGGVDVVGKVVVDVGAYVGDSAIYFALKGAERVVAIEPHPGAFEEMLENIKLNNLEGKVIPINAGLASRHGRICLEDADTESTGVAYHRLGDCTSSVEAITLNEVLSKYVGSNDKPLLLKMDCEGCEYDVILNDYESIKKFNELIFEYHAHAVKRPVRELLSMLDKDFECRRIRGNDELGVIKCARRS